jgi:sporadic carbohydrate cluster 2OG-Fe(II) oxygenase/sporadic carbohydrate cluster protein (TIGR04323 family)
MHLFHSLFDNKTLDYDTSEYDFSGLILQQVQNHYPEVTQLDTIHEYMDTSKLFSLGHTVNRELYSTNFYQMFDEVVSNYVSDTGIDILIQRFPSIRFLPPNQDKSGRVLQFHQGRWVGNGLGLYTVWMPFTECFDSNSMQILDLDISREITRDAIRDNWDYETLENICKKYMWPINLKPGQAHLFTQEHLHGNIPNRTNKTRVSIDCRILVRDGQFHRKWPGSYFRPLNRILSKKPEFNESSENIVTYAEYEGSKTHNLDLHYQTLLVKDYCRRAGITFPYQHGENEGFNRLNNLENLVKDTTIDHILMMSIYSLTDNPEHRVDIMRKAISNNIKLHFCNEDMILENEQDLEDVEYLRNFTTDTSDPVVQLQKELNLL